MGDQCNVYQNWLLILFALKKGNRKICCKYKEGNYYSVFLAKQTAGEVAGHPETPDTWDSCSAVSGKDVWYAN